jgi:hypothetical protein
VGSIDGVSTNYGNIIGWANTSNITTGYVVSSARLYYYVNSYTISKGMTRDISISVGNDSIIINKAASGTAWQYETLTGNELNFINRTGLTPIIFFHAYDPGSGSSFYKNFVLRAREYSRPNTYDMYLNLTISPAPSGYCGGSYSGSGNWLITTTTVCSASETIPLPASQCLLMKKPNACLIIKKSATHIIRRKP